MKILPAFLDRYISHSKHMSHTILYNKWVLYAVFVCVLLNVVHLVASDDLFSVVVLIISGFLTAFFSKNMVVIFCIALAVTFVVKYGARATLEGLDKLHPKKNKENQINKEITKNKIKDHKK